MQRQMYEDATIHHANAQDLRGTEQIFENECCRLKMEDTTETDKKN